MVLTARKNHDTHARGQIQKISSSKPIIWWYKRWYILTINFAILGLARDQRHNVADSLSAINRHSLIIRIKMDLIDGQWCPAHTLCLAFDYFPVYTIDGLSCMNVETRRKRGNTTGILGFQQFGNLTCIRIENGRFTTISWYS